MNKLVANLFLALLMISQSSFSFDVNMKEDKFNKFLASGSLDGFFTYDEFWKFFEDVRNTGSNDKYLTQPISIGRSYENREMKGFYICDNSSLINKYLSKKNIILFTSVHHSREPLSLTMIVLMIREILKLMVLPGQSKMKELLRDNVIFFIPVMNPDSYIYINQNYYGPNSKNIRMIRKNRHLSSMCNDWTGGVDLNRNYDMKFGADEDGSSSNPCHEDYRGTTPFSEPETLALKNYVDGHTNIVTDVNIHTYGNAWIYPYNYVNDKSNELLRNKNRLFFDYYNEFIGRMKHKNLKALFGNAAFALDYSTNGEAGDWFTGKKKILNIDVELGNNDKKSEQFYPPKSILSDIVRYNWLAMKEYLYTHIVDFNHRVVYYPSQINFEIINVSISALIDPTMQFSFISGDNQELKPSQIRYCIKDLLADKCSNSKKFNRVIRETIKGRHVLEIQLFFSNKNELEKLKGIKMKLDRNVPGQNYQTQNFYFKKSN